MNVKSAATSAVTQSGNLNLSLRVELDKLDADIHSLRKLRPVTFWEKLSVQTALWVYGWRHKQTEHLRRLT